MAGANLTAARLRELLDYDPETGEFRWREARGGRFKGSLAGSVAKGATGYKCWVIRLERRIYGASRLAWLYQTGCWPEHEIDHIDGNPLNNRIENLRDIPHRMNMENVRKPMPFNKSRLIGANFDKSRNNWIASVSVGNKSKYVGRFSTAIEAHEAYLAAKRRLHAGCTI